MIGLVVAALWLVPIVLTLLSEQATPGGRYLGHLSALLFATLFILLATALGDWILDFAFRLNRPFLGRSLFAAGLGLGAFALATFGIGFLILPTAFVAWCVAVILAILLARRTGRVLERLRECLARFRDERNLRDIALVIIAVVLLGLNIVRAFVPPTEYDEMEYHLAVPARHIRDGRIATIHDNVYAHFPQNVEMLFLDAMVLRGGVIEGLALGRLLNVGLGVLAACAVGAFAAAVFSTTAAVPAAVIIYTWPWIGHLSQVGYVELGLMLYAGLALLAGWHWHHSGRDCRYLVLLGAVCGLAAGCKYPAVLFVCIPAGLFVLISGRERRFRQAAVLTVVALAVFSPWLIRNAVATRNPVYPLLGHPLGGREWTGRKIARWGQAHRPDSFAPASMWSAVRNAALQTHPPEGESRTYRMSLLLVLFAPLAFVRGEWRRRAAVLLVLVAGCLIAWLVFTHRIPRFLVPWLLPLAAVSAAGSNAIGRRTIYAGLACLLVLLAGVEAHGTIRLRSPAAEFALFLGHYDIHEAVAELKREATYSHEATQAINELPPDSLTLFYGEARTLYCERDVIAPTVFDENLLDDLIRAATSPGDLRDRLEAKGITHIYVNLPDLYRLQWSYAFEYDGRIWHGYCTLEDTEEVRGLFRAFLADHCRLVYPSDLPDRYAEYVRDEFVRVMHSHQRDRPPHEPAHLPRHLLIDVPEQLLPEGEWAAPRLPRQLSPEAFHTVWRNLQFVLFEIGG